MAVVMNMEWPGVTSAQYEQARKMVNWEGNVPSGAQFHVAAFNDKGLCITDIWDSAEDFQRFVDQRLTPATQKIGIQGQPNVEILPVHAIFAPAYEPARAGSRR